LKTSLTRYSSNILCVSPAATELKRGIADAVAIASDNDLRVANYTRSNIARDWNDALEPALQWCREWISEERYHV
jgi:hypothetical protein